MATKSHVRNVAGHKLLQLGRAVYKQELPGGKQRWFVRYGKLSKDGGFRKRGKFRWRYTEPFTDTPTKESKPFDTLTDAVIAANRKR